MNAQPRIAILMASYNGAAFLAEQLDSILAQDWENWTLTVSDDGSMDGTVAILRRYEQRNPGRVRVVTGPGRGYVANFMALTAKAGQEADYVAWSDQDDVWAPRKLSWAVEALAPFGQTEPALYCAGTVETDAGGVETGRFAPARRVAPGFGNALFDCLGGGLTMVLNRPARDLLLLGLGHGMVSHDWWAYLIVSGAGGHVVTDPRPVVRHRFHGENVCTRKPNPGLWLSKAIAASRGKYGRDVGSNLEALWAARGWLTPGNRERLEAMVGLHGGGGGPFGRLLLAKKAGLCRQSRFKTALIYAMAALGWL